MLARALFGRNEPAGAAAALLPGRGYLGDLEAVGAQLLGESLLLSGAASRALEPLRHAAALAPDSPAGNRAAALLADALHESGQEESAVAQAETASRLPAQPAQVKAGLAATRAAALAAIARALAHRAPAAAATSPDAARGAAHEALLAARAFWLEHPDHPAAALVPAVEAELAPLAGGPLPAPSGSELGVRASRLLAAGRPAAAVAQAQEALRRLAGADAAEVELLLARALGADGRRAEATAALEASWRAGAARVAPEAGLLLARDRARRGKQPEAVSLLDQLTRRFPDATEADEAAYLAARLLLEQGKDAPARARLLKLARRRTAHGSDARWTLAWLAFKAHGRAAPELFAAFAAGAADDAARAQGLYWQARASKPSAAEQLLARVAALDPLGWYGLLAAKHTTRETPPFPPPAAAASPPPAPAQAALPAHLAVADQLLELGFLAEAAAEVDRYVHQHHRHAADLLPALAAYERAGRYDRSVVLAQNLLLGHAPPLEFREPGRAAQGAQDATVRALLQAAYPAAYPSQVAASARRAGLDPYFVLAIARRESLFRPDARSAAGAVGLLQLTPATARRAAAVLGRPASRDDELFDPATAIDLGAWYLAELVGRFGDASIAAAAYNAGPRAAGPWAEHGRGERLDEWVEDIPFRETRIYVKAVIGAWSAYRILAGGAPPSLAPTVPEVRAGVEF